MFIRRWFGVLSFMGCLLLFLAVFLSGSIYNRITELNGQVSMDKVTLCLDENRLLNEDIGFRGSNRQDGGGNQDGGRLDGGGSQDGGSRLDEGSPNGISRLNGPYFSAEDIDGLIKSMNTEVITCSAQVTCTILNGNKALKAGVVGADELAPMFGNIPVVSGSFFSEADCREKSRVIVIDSDTAWKLFNNDDVLGCYVDIFGSRFKIIGIIESDRSVIGRLTAGGSAKAYIPVQTLLDISSDAGITYVQCKTDPKRIIGMSTRSVTEALLSIGKNPDNYIWKAYDVKGAEMAQKPALLILLMGLFIIYALLSHTVSFFKKTIRSIRKACQTDYLSHAAVQYRSEIIKGIVLLILTVTASIIIWTMVRFSVYIPPDMIPVDLTDISYYFDQIFKKASEIFTADAYTVPLQEIKSNAAETIFGRVFYGGSLLGFLIFYTGLAGLTELTRQSCFMRYAETAGSTGYTDYTEYTGLTRSSGLTGSSGLTRSSGLTTSMAFTRSSGLTGLTTSAELAGYHIEEIKPEKLLLIFGGFLTAALVIYLLIALLAGLPAMVGLKDMIIFWSFILVNILRFSIDEKKMIRGTEPPDIQHKYSFDVK